MKSIGLGVGPFLIKSIKAGRIGAYYTYFIHLFIISKGGLRSLSLWLVTKYNINYD